LAGASCEDSIYLLGATDEVVKYTTTLFRYAVSPYLGSVQGNFSLVNQGGDCGGPDTCLSETLSGTVPLNGVISLSASAFLNTTNVGLSAMIEIAFGPITLTDAQGNPITGVPYISDSGTAYLRDEVLVPEPGTSLLLIGGLLTMLVFARRSRKA
jgi:hypothetical protein